MKLGPGKKSEFQTFFETVPIYVEAASMQKYELSSYIFFHVFLRKQITLEVQYIEKKKIREKELKWKR